MSRHSFDVQDAIDHGVEKAVILSNLRFWLDKVRANKRDDNTHDGYYWTYNSVAAFCELFPYLSKGKIQRHLNSLESEGVILSGSYNKHKYDRTKWYSMPEFKTNDSTNQETNYHSLDMVNGNLGNSEPIPYVNPDVNPDVNHTIVTEKSEADLLVDFWNDNRPASAAVKKEVWSKVIKTRLKTFSADEIKTAMLTVINSQWHQQNKQVLIKNAVDSDKRCAEAIEKSSQKSAGKKIDRDTDKLAVNNNWAGANKSNIVAANTNVEDMFGASK